MLTASNLSVFRNGKPVVGPIEISVKKGQGIGLIGANGSGKTSTLLGLLGLLKTQGSIKRDFTTRELGVVWQDRGLPLNIRVSAWTGYLSGLYGVKPDQTLFERFELPLDNRRIRELSGGQQQKLAVISAFGHKPKFLILDEPTVGLDEKSRIEFVAICRESKINGSSILVTSHSASDIVSISDEVIPLSFQKGIEKFLFTTDRGLTDQEVNELKTNLLGFSLTLTENGYVLAGKVNPFTMLAQLSQKCGFTIKSFTELK